ncbi:MAG: hypothetical protein JXQ76_10395 [Campylobacterales bacterium]|nr:hypothetical protein [Campylobacterales bacterium]
MFKTLLFLLISLSIFLGCNKSSNSTQAPETNITQPNPTQSNAPMMGEYRSRTLFENPYANIPAQCYIETSYGTQNACLFCHTNAPARAMLGNTTPQAGMDSLLGNLQLEYAFGAANRFAVSPNINPWENTLLPHKLDEAFEQLGIDANLWDMQNYIKQDNWSAAFAKKQGVLTSSNSGIKDDPYRLLPALNPKALPAQSDGFVRTAHPNEALFQDSKGYNTGWRSINFMPYGIFTPHTGSVSGVYIRLPKEFMQNEAKVFDIETYKQNLELLEQAIQDRIEGGATHYVGAASTIKLHRGLFPVGTEFAHPLHYVDVQADGVFEPNNTFPGTRANRVKEVRYMYKWKMYYPQEPVSKDEDAPLYYNKKENWIDNGAGWYLAGFIEDKEGNLRPQESEELMQCVGCHSSRYGFEPEQFNSGTGNTIDTVWSFPRKFAGDLGWKEMDYLAYRFANSNDENKTAGDAHRGDPINRDANIGEYRKFLNHVVGASLYGDMPHSMEKYLQSTITQANGYSDNFPSLEFDSVEQLKQIQQKRLELMREFTEKKDYLDSHGYIQAPLLYPTLKESLTGAMRYKKVVATQRYTKGKDYFGDTLFTYKYYRDKNQSHTHIDGTPYHFGEVIIDRPYHLEESILWGVGKVPTLIDEAGDNYDPEYMPLLKYPLTFESK